MCCHLSVVFIHFHILTERKHENLVVSSMSLLHGYASHQSICCSQVTSFLNIPSYNQVALHLVYESETLS